MTRVTADAAAAASVVAAVAGRADGQIDQGLLAVEVGAGGREPFAAGRMIRVAMAVMAGIRTITEGTGLIVAAVAGCG